MCRTNNKVCELSNNILHTRATTRVAGHISSCYLKSFADFIVQGICLLLHYVLFNMSSCLTSWRTDVAFISESGCKVTTFFELCKFWGRKVILSFFLLCYSAKLLLHYRTNYIIQGSRLADIAKYNKQVRYSKIAYKLPSGYRTIFVLE